MLTVPELGGPLGRVSSTRAGHVPDPPLDAIRLELATDLFESAGRAREFLKAKEIEASVHALGPGAWTAAWERAVTAASDQLIGRLVQQFEDAARLSRMPAPFLKRYLPTEAERLAIAAHLGKGSGRLEQALETLDLSAASLLERPDATDCLVAWHDALDLAGRRIEAGWIELEEAVLRELQRWALEINTVRDWRRPRWPMWVATGVVVGVAVYLGLVFGGFVEPPAVLRPMAEFFWEHV